MELKTIVWFLLTSLFSLSLGYVVFRERRDKTVLEDFNREVLDRFGELFTELAVIKNLLETYNRDIKELEQRLDQVEQRNLEIFERLVKLESK